MRQAGSEQPDLDIADVEDAVGEAAFARGLEYARNGAVVKALWNPRARTVVGTVRGSGGRTYTTTAWFTDPSSGFDGGRCSCPVGADCKHVVAIALVAAGIGEAEPSQGRPGNDLGDWERSLGLMLDSHPSGLADATPLAIELSVVDGRSGQKVLARVVRPGKRGGWVAGDLSWTRLGYAYGDYPASHVRLLRELHALSQATTVGYSAYGNYYGDQKTIDLAAVDSPRFWSLLAEAQATGLRVVHSSRRLDVVPVDGAAELTLDVTTDESGKLVVLPRVRTSESPGDPVPVGFVGKQAHGIVLTDRADAARPPGQWRLWLARLDKPAPPQLQDMALSGKRIEIPASQRERFTAEFYPRLRHIATVVSSDGSFSPPEISDPELRLVAEYGDGHRLSVGWSWVYEVGGSLVRFAAGAAADDGIRSPEAERAAVVALDPALAAHGLLRERPARTLVPSVTFGGIDTMRFTTEVLPLLRDIPDVVVEVVGEPAEYREAGDSLRIGVSAVSNADSESSDTDWFDLGVTITVEGREVPFTDVFTALARDESHLLLPDGAFFSLQKPELQSLRRLIDEARTLQDGQGEQLRISRFQAALWEELRDLGVVDQQAESWRRQVEGLLAVGSQEPPEVPATVTARLRPYQAEGFAWLAFLWQHGLGGVLADDMGLGKTLQTLALISHARQTDPGLPPFLIVAPASVVSNWVAEAARFTPDLAVVGVTETLARRGETLEDVARADVVVISYALLRLDIDEYGSGAWAGLVLDEAQFAKNHTSKVYQCARRVPAPFKLAITGTPMENNLMELWSLLSITAPGLFPSPARFKEYYARPIERGQGAELLPQLRRRIRPLLKRRTKEQVAADLPAKQEQVLEVELHPRHRTVYQRHLQRERQKVLGLLDDVDRNRFTILRSLTLLRQLALHAALVDDAHDGVPSSKIEALAEQLREVVDGGHRALVFSQFTGFLGHVRARLEADGVAYCYLDGRTRGRQEVIEGFKQGSAPVFLISLKAGGFGLNLTEADYCFLLDPWWNPATEAQAVDRTHRIGQTRNVMVYRMIAADTIEEKVMALKQRKAELFASVLSDGAAFGSSLDAEDIRALLA